LTPLSPSSTLKLVNAVNPVTTLALVTARKNAAIYKLVTVWTRASRIKLRADAIRPVLTTMCGGARRVNDPWRMDAVSPMKPRSLPESLDSNEKRSKVMNGNENSMPEKIRRKKRWVALRRASDLFDGADVAVVVVVPVADCVVEFVLISFCVLAASTVFLTTGGRVSGSFKYR